MNDKSDIVTAKYRAVGAVQEVGFRRFLQREAGERGVCGWARNEPDGSLVALFCGGQKMVGEMHAALKTGPDAAEVVSVTELLPEDADDVPPDAFELR